MPNPLYFLAILATCAGLDQNWPQVVRSEMKRQNTSPWVTVQNAVMQDVPAYTSADLKNVYIDYERFKAAPNALLTTLRHELAHTNGHTHFDGSTYMQYAVSETPDGYIINDVASIP